MTRESRFVVHPSGILQLLITFDEVSDLGLYWSFLQVLDHHVGNSCQVTHVASPGATLSPKIDRDTLTICKVSSLQHHNSTCHSKSITMWQHMIF